MKKNNYVMDYSYDWYQSFNNWEEFYKLKISGVKLDVNKKREKVTAFKSICLDNNEELRDFSSMSSLERGCRDSDGMLNQIDEDEFEEEEK